MSYEGYLEGADGCLQVNLMLASESSKDKPNYMVHSSRAEADVELETWQVEEEIFLTKVEEGRLKGVLKRFAEDQAAKMNLTLTMNSFCPDQISRDMKNFSQSWASSYQEYHIVRDHLARLTWLRDYYLPTKCISARFKFVERLEKLDLEMAKNEETIMARNENPKLKLKRKFALQEVKERIIKALEEKEKMEELLIKVESEIGTYMKHHPELKLIHDATDIEGKKLSERYHECQLKLRKNLDLRKNLCDRSYDMAHGAVHDMEDAIDYVRSN